MKSYLILPIAALSALSFALVIPNEQVLNDVVFENEDDHADADTPVVEQSFVGLLDSFGEPIEDVMDDFWDGIVNKTHSGTDVQFDDVDTWVDDLGFDDDDDNNNNNNNNNDDEDQDEDKKHPHHPPHHPPLPPHPHPPHGPSNLTIYEFIQRSKHTTKLAKLVNEDEELINLLNNKNTNHTVFAPTDYAFSKIPKHVPEPSKEFIRDVLRYHTSPGLNYYSTGPIFHTSHRTLPTLLNESALGDDLPQRLVVRVGLRGSKVNHYSRVVASNIQATNGLVHGIDSILFPPPKTFDLLNLLPTHFSTFVLGLTETGLVETHKDNNDNDKKRKTTFAPLNSAFEKLGSKTTTFLFSSKGKKYLKALLQYHISQNRALYSDVLYTEDGKVDPLFGQRPRSRLLPIMHTHIDLPTLLRGHGLAVDIARFDPWGSYSMRINGFQPVTFADGIAADGVVHVVRRVLIPPRHVGRKGEVGDDDDGDYEVSIEDLKERLRLNGLIDEEKDEEDE